MDTPSSKNLPFCINWPWDNTNTKTPNPCTFQTPFIIQSAQTIGKLTFNLFNTLTQTPHRKPNGGLKSATTIIKKPSLSPKEQGEAEQRALALALASGKDATIMEFYSPKCRLCSSMMGIVGNMEERNGEWLSIVMADAENQDWLPELLHYDVKYVPCFVLLDKQGKAIAKTGVPTSRMHVIAGLSHLIKLKKPTKFSVKVAS